jgi:SAM-dependent methyltransferase
VTPRVSRRVRSTSFGRDPAAFDRARLRYPKRVYELLTKRCGLHPGTVAFEIGPGTGIATRELLRRGAAPMTLIEPDRRLARYLVRSLRSKADRVIVLTKPFEDVSLPSANFDLGVAASSFHWTPERRALGKIARALKPGGWWAAWGNRHGDPFRPSAFHEALQPLYRTLSNGRAGGEFNKAAATKERAGRMAALRSMGKFDHISREEIRWTVHLTSAQVRALW